MKGVNKMFFNEATLIEAVQRQFNFEFAEGSAPKVTGVSWDPRELTFEVTVESPDGP